MAGVLMSVLTSHPVLSHSTASGDELPHYREKAEVEVIVGGKKEKLKANRFGMCPRVYVGANEVVEVKVEYPEIGRAHV